MWLKGVTLLCRRHAYAETWLNGEMIFVGVTTTPKHFQCRSTIILFLFMVNLNQSNTAFVNSNNILISNLNTVLKML